MRYPARTPTNAASFIKPPRLWAIRAQLSRCLARRRERCALRHLAPRLLNEIGTTPAEYLLRWRVSLPQSMLLAGSSIKLASEQLGYASAASFSRAFVQSVGASPRAWLQGRQV